MPKIENWDKKWSREGPESESLWKHSNKDIFVRVRQASRSDWVAERDNQISFDTPTPITNNRVYKRQRFAKQKIVEWMRKHPNP